MADLIRLNKLMMADRSPVTMSSVIDYQPKGRATQGDIVSLSMHLKKQYMSRAGMGPWLAGIIIIDNLNEMESSYSEKIQGSYLKPSIMFD